MPDDLVREHIDSKKNSIEKRNHSQNISSLCRGRLKAGSSIRVISWFKNLKELL